MALTAKQRRFVAEYLKDLNATQAAIRCGYSEKTAYAQGHRLLKKAEISEAIGVKAEARLQRAEITVDWVISGIKAVGDDPESERRDKLKAYELGGKLHKLFTDKHEVAGQDGGPLVVEIRKVTERE